MEGGQGRREEIEGVEDAALRGLEIASSEPSTESHLR